MTDTTMKTRGAVPGPSATTTPTQAEYEARALVEHKPQPATTQVESRAATVQPEPLRLVTIDQPIGEIAGAIASVMAEVGVVQRAGENRFHNYKYATMGDILIAITPLIGKAGLAIMQNEISRAVTSDMRVTVTYEFAILHKSGQYWPERPRFTGMCNAKTSKGDLDDKAINKCHTAARKYFLLSLFQVPTGDIDDADDDDAPKQQTPQTRPAQNRGPVPGPSQQQKPEPRIINQPHKIVLGEGTGADQWANAYIKALGTAKTLAELKAWDTLNDGALEGLHKRYPEVYALVCQAYEMREAGLTAGADPQTGELPPDDVNTSGPLPNDEIVLDDMPVVGNDPTAAVNWVASRLTELSSVNAIDEFWSETVEPFLGEFSEPDVAVLTGERRRATAKAAGQKTR